MDDVTAQVALISTSGTVAVALIGALGGVFGERWWQARQAKRAAAAEQSATRYEALLGFTQALLAWVHNSTDGRSAQLSAARIGFVAVLGPGEGGIGTATLDLIEQVRNNALSRRAIAMAGSDALFSWLRGELTVDRVQSIIIHKQALLSS